ncbi:MAG: hypothetical protein P8Z75_13740 [Gammaproteobacteria bacterium]|jgi:hypothetical protein
MGNDDSLSAGLRRAIDDASHKAQQTLEAEAEQLRMTTVAEAQKEILSWVKIQFWAVTVALGLFIGFLAFFGYQRYEDFVVAIDKQKEEVGVQAHAAQVAIAENQTAVLEQIDKSKDYALENIERLNAISDQVKKFEDKYSVDKIEKQLTQYEEVFRNIDQLRGEAVAALKNIRMLGNSRYRFVVHITQTSTQARDQEIQHIMKVFDEQGYVIGPENFKDITADQCQVLYYNPAVKGKAQAVVALLDKTYPGMTAQQQPSYIDRDPYLMLIKVPSPSAGTDCRG